MSTTGSGATSSATGVEGAWAGGGCYGVMHLGPVEVGDVWLVWGWNVEDGPPTDGEGDPIAFSAQYAGGGATAITFEQAASMAEIIQNGVTHRILTNEITITQCSVGG